MANQRAKNVKRVTLTLPDKLLKAIEEDSKKSGQNRLDYIRQVLQSKVETDIETQNTPSK